MGNINVGDQLVTFRYENEASSQSFNTVIHELLSRGVYTGGLVAKQNDNLVTLAPSVVILSDPVANVSVRCQTRVDAPIGISPDSNYIIMRLTWLNQINNYVDILSTDLAHILTKDIIIAKANYNLDTLESFDYTVQTKNLFNVLSDRISQEQLDRLTQDGLLQTAIDNKFNTSDMSETGGTGKNGKGVLTNSYGQIDLSFFSESMFINIFTVNSQAEMLALPAQKSDIARRQDEYSTYVLVGSNPASLTDWEILYTPVVSVAGKIGTVLLNKTDVGLSNVDNTSDANKPVSSATSTALGFKVNTSDTATTATANKLLYLDANSKLPASITGDSANSDTVDSQHVDNTNAGDSAVTDALWTAYKVNTQLGNKLNTSALSDSTPSALGTATSGVSLSVSRADHVHEELYAVSNSDINNTYAIPIEVKKILTATGITTLSINDTTFRTGKENWIDVTILNPIGHFITFPSNWKWANNVSAPSILTQYNIVGWSSDNVNWNVGYIVLGV